MPIDFGTHQRLNSSGFDHASNTRRAGASNDRVTTTSRSDFRSTFVMFFVGASSLVLLRPSDFSFCFSSSMTWSSSPKRASQSW